MPMGHHLDDRARERIIRMREQGVPSTEVARAQQISQNTVNRIFKNHVDSRIRSENGDFGPTDSR